MFFIEIINSLYFADAKLFKEKFNEAKELLRTQGEKREQEKENNNPAVEDENDEEVTKKLSELDVSKKET